MERLGGWMFSIGEPMITMCESTVWLLASMMQSSVELFPEPVIPVTSVNPCLS